MLHLSCITCYIHSILHKKDFSDNFGFHNQNIHEASHPKYKIIVALPMLLFAVFFSSATTKSTNEPTRKFSYSKQKNTSLLAFTLFWITAKFKKNVTPRYTIQINILV